MSKQSMSSKGVRHDTSMLMTGYSDVNHFVRISRYWLHHYIRNITYGNEIQEESSYMMSASSWFVFKSVRFSTHSLGTLKGIGDLPVLVIVFLIFTLSVLILFTMSSITSSLFLVTFSTISSQEGSSISGEKL